MKKVRWNNKGMAIRGRYALIFVLTLALLLAGCGSASSDAYDDADEISEDTADVDIEESADEEEIADDAEEASAEEVTEEDIAAEYGEITASGTCGDALNWYYTANGTLVITGTGEMDNYPGGDNETAPWSHLNNATTQIVIFDGVTTIGEQAFISTAAASVILPETLEEIGIYAFSDADNLEEIEIPGSVYKISDEAFSYCDILKNVTLSDGLTIMGEDVFRKDSCLEEIIIPDTVTEIGENVFTGCSSLKTVTLSESLTTISSATFSGCESLTEIIIPDSVTLIDEYAFRECTALHSVTIGTGISKIEIGAFAYCSSLNDITFCGNAPSFKSAFERGDLSPLLGVTATIYYPEGNLTWETLISDSEGDETFYGGTITFEAY